jgi:hypothetical protein
MPHDHLVAVSRMPAVIDNSLRRVQHTAAAASAIVAQVLEVVVGKKEVCGGCGLRMH